MLRKLLTLLLACMAMGVQAAQILWFDVNAPESKVGSIPFIDYFENHTIAGKAETDGIDLVAIGSNGEFLYSIIGEPFIVWLQKESADGYSYSAMTSQVDVTTTDSIKLMAGYFDWDSLGDDDEITLDLFTPYAYLESSMTDISKYVYEDFQLSPSVYWTPTQWNPINEPVPEPSSVALIVLGLAAVLAGRGGRGNG